MTTHRRSHWVCTRNRLSFASLEQDFARYSVAEGAGGNSELERWRASMRGPSQLTKRLLTSSAIPKALGRANRPDERQLES